MPMCIGVCIFESRSHQCPRIGTGNRAEIRGAKSPNEIVFTHGATESINLVASCFCRAFCKEGDEILITAMEHHSNIVPWQLQGDIMGIKLQVVPINENGELRLNELEKKFLHVPN